MSPKKFEVVVRPEEGGPSFVVCVTPDQLARMIEVAQEEKPLLSTKIGKYPPVNHSSYTAAANELGVDVRSLTLRCQRARRKLINQFEYAGASVRLERLPDLRKWQTPILIVESGWVGSSLTKEFLGLVGNSSSGQPPISVNAGDCFYSVQEAATRLGVTERTIQRGLDKLRGAVTVVINGAVLKKGR